LKFWSARSARARSATIAPRRNCNADKLAYPIRDGIPVMLVDEARQTVEGTPVDPNGPGAA
jgi:uncharacterized protein YbaR (Trm112 family)